MHFIDSKDFFIIAHRGSSRFTENTISAFNDAVSAGVDAVELDVQLTKDSVPVIFHDLDAKRLANVDRKIYNMSARDIKSLSLPGNERVPTLIEVLENFKGMNIFLELKFRDDVGEKRIKDTVSRVHSIINARNAINRIVIISFNHDAIELFKKMDKNARVGYLFYRPDKIINDDKIKIDVLLPFYELVDNEFMKNYSKYKIIPWTVNDMDEFNRLKNLGVSGIISDKAIDFLSYVVP
ncbi:glycerophosphodiester phosphodiesterase [Picrophilus oshimae]|uniref:Glycerophosphoryl diester phosphodiesterase n=1 Tax=Picrophilus torridus (strain ATCC 700027 / DSM 9790 / JCM 10055 / NBRC 100828 / KAW 2/3) TaxID=1122961 RepID=Q6L1D1_PICTO|nr:glycerophosphodiester phosphodiesterase [Picrophilus oshimae]AAT43221.1 glycerophosphoryl diester phosphodiesterase [Picrophilus oshimae DSM 9789]SMD30474.1 glycerophosphoryl diester phosphodiesterase [Picrophilus oshimae DSM 9789]